ncbi:MAG: hypothetical protein JOY81_06885, partial [Alphaproteobacteria bacterium]|nr:hypothetical protein [Alphaproteobacteria bacterium]
MSRSTVVSLVVALMLGSGIAGYLIGNPPQSLERPPAPVASAPKPSTPATTPASNNPAPVALPQPTAAPSEQLAYRRTGVDSSHADAEACLSFNMPLATSDSVKYADYVRIAPEVKSSMHVVDDRLCIGGLAYGQDYAVTLLKGFPSRSGATLASEQKVAVALGARPAVVSLPGKGFILPRGEAVGLPITTVNVAKVGVAVFRLNERGINAWNRWGNNFPSSQPVTESWTLRGWLNGSNGVQLWRGNMKVRNALNQSVTTAFPIRDAVKDWKPGAYFVVAWNAAKPPAKDDDDDDSSNDDASSSDAMVGTWVVDTDVALTSFTGRDGLTVFARSLHSAQPVPGLEVTLLSRGNEPIGKAMTGQDGRAVFAAGLLKGKGAAEPVAVMATDQNKQDFSRLELTKSAFDLSDRGIDGRDQPGPVDAYLYTERGIYRPGETVHLMAMLRDEGATALANMPVTLIVHRPDGSEFTRYALALPTSGSLYQAIPIPKGSRRGQWSVTAHIDPKAPAVGTIDFAVQDFVPEKLKVEMASDANILRNGKKNGFTLSADFLYGAPASGLTVEGDMRVMLDDTPFPAFSAYSFGLEQRRDKFDAPLITLSGPDTDDKGKSRLEWPGTGVNDTSLPLKAQVEVRVFEPGNGRATKTSKTFAFRTREAYIGIASTFSGRYAPEGTETSFDLVAVDAAGKQIAMADVDYTIRRTTYSYQWYQSNGRWYWQSTDSRHV